jgi:predicted transcriptional regulator
MVKNYNKLTPKIIELLEKDPGQTIKELAKKLDVNRSFLAGYLKALEDQKRIRSKEVGPARLYFNNKVGI